MYILMDTETVKNWPPSYWSKYRSSDYVMNPIARGSFCWGFQKGLNCSKYLPQTDSYWDVADMCVRGWHQNECLTYPVETANNKEIILFQRDYHKIRVGLQLEKVIECHLRQVFKPEVDLKQPEVNFFYHKDSNLYRRVNSPNRKLAHYTGSNRGILKSFKGRAT